MIPLIPYHPYHPRFSMSQESCLARICRWSPDPGSCVEHQSQGGFPGTLTAFKSKDSSRALWHGRSCSKICCHGDCWLRKIAAMILNLYLVLILCSSSLAILGVSQTGWNFCAFVIGWTLILPLVPQSPRASSQLWPCASKLDISRWLHPWCPFGTRFCCWFVSLCSSLPWPFFLPMFFWKDHPCCSTGYVCIKLTRSWKRKPWNLYPSLWQTPSGCWFYGMKHSWEDCGVCYEMAVFAMGSGTPSSTDFWWAVSASQRSSSFSKLTPEFTAHPSTNHQMSSGQNPIKPLLFAICIYIGDYNYILLTQLHADFNKQS